MIRARIASEPEERGWDELVAATGRGHMLQSVAWAELKAMTGWGVRRYVLEEDGERRGVAQILRKTLPLGITVAYGPRAPLVVGEDLVGAILGLRDALARERCASLLVDPEVPDEETLRARIAASPLRRSPVFVQPRRTLLMDLSRDPEDLLGEMRKKTRQYIHKAERAAVVTEETRDLDRFLAILRVVAARDRFALHGRAYYARLLELFGERAHVLMARIANEDVGAMLLVRIGDRAWELYGGWSGTHGEARPFYLLKWRAMQRMRALGARRYDMWGLAEGADDPLAGVENFKLGFGGEIATWIGPLEVPVRAALYPLWRLAARGRLARSAA